MCHNAPSRPSAPDSARRPSMSYSSLDSSFAFLRLCGRCLSSRPVLRFLLPRPHCAIPCNPLLADFCPSVPKPRLAAGSHTCATLPSRISYERSTLFFCKRNYDCTRRSFLTSVGFYHGQSLSSHAMRARKIASSFTIVRASSWPAAQSERRYFVDDARASTRERVKERNPERVLDSDCETGHKRLSSWHKVCQTKCC